MAVHKLCILSLRGLGLGQTIDFLEALRFSFPVPVVGPRARDELSLSCSLLPLKRLKIYRSRFALVKKFELDL